MSNAQEARSERLAVRLPPTLKEAVTELAVEDDVTLSKWIERAIRAEVERRKRAN
jgi:predicted HicB family RNase H-like nuclease